MARREALTGRSGPRAVGVSNGTRTRDLVFTKDVLYQLSYVGAMVGRAGFEPAKAKASGVTVRPIWPLWNLPGYCRLKDFRLAISD